MKQRNGIPAPAASQEICGRANREAKDLSQVARRLGEMPDTRGKYRWGMFLWRLTLLALPVPGMKCHTLFLRWML